MKLFKLIIRLLTIIVGVSLFCQFKSQVLAIDNPGAPTAPPTQPPGNCVCGHPNIHLLTCVPVVDQNNCRSDLAPNCVNGPICNSCNCILPPSPTPPGSNPGTVVTQDPYCTDKKHGISDSEPQVRTAIGCIPVDTTLFVKWILQMCFGIIGGISFLLIIYGFIQIATSGGDPKKMQGAKETISSAIIGLLFVIFSLLIINLLLVNIFHLPGIRDPNEPV